MALINESVLWASADKLRGRLTEHTEKKWLKKEDLKTLNFAPADKPILDMIK